MPRGKKKIVPRDTSDSTQSSVLTVSDEAVDENTTISLQTKEQAIRQTPAVIEKSRDAEKSNAPTILIHWTDASGKKCVRSYSCSEVKIFEETSETLLKSGKKTTLNVSIEATVLERDSR